MTTFEQRLARIEATHGPVKKSNMILSYGEPADVQEPFNPLVLLLLLPFAIALGAASVVAGGVFQVAILDGGLGAASPVPPALGPSAFGIVLVLCVLVDRLTRSDHIGPIAVTLGFVGMLWGEGRLAQMYPELWTQIYQAEYLFTAMEAVGL